MRDVGQIQAPSSRKLGAALREISGGRWDVDVLLTDHAPAFADFDRQLDEFLRVPPASVADGPSSEATAPSAVTEETPSATSLLVDYCRNWRSVIWSRDSWRIAQLRLDRYVWPGLSWERPSRRPDGDPSFRERNAGERDEATWRAIDELLKSKRVVLHDDAGMGKTAFTYMCLDRLLDQQNWTRCFDGRPPLVVRLEGVWPRRDSRAAPSATDSNIPPPLSVREMLVDKLLHGLRLAATDVPGEQTPDELLRAAEREVSEALRDGRVVVIVDAFDQMTDDDRRHVAGLLGQDPLDDGADRSVARCAWLLTGRAYAIKHYEDRWPDSTRRLRLEPFNESQQDAYFADLAEHEFFRQQQARPLDWICKPRSNLAEDLGLPLNLREIRTLIEDSLPARDVPQAIAVELLSARRISTTGQLHALVARVLLERALKHVAERREREQVARGHPQPVRPDKGEPETNDGKLQLLMQVCGLLALQMMLDKNYNASVDRLTRLPGQAQGEDGIRAFLDRARHRYLAATPPVDRPIDLPGADPEPTPLDRWNWAVMVLEQIEVTHRGDIDNFNRECRSFRDRKTMEWYAAHYLMNYATHSDLNQRIAGAGDHCVLDFASDEQWGSNCWRQAIEMPRDLVQEAVAVESLSVLFRRPDGKRGGHPRPCELMWLAWERWLEPVTAPVDSERGIPRPLPGASRLIEKFRSEFQELCDAGSNLALSLRFDSQRDQPDKECGNKTPPGQYRRIPPEGPNTSFRGERPVAVTVSAFWLRKFVVTNAEYRLFDSHFKSRYSSEFNKPDRPVVGVTWYAAAMFCRWLGGEYRLPTEAEWEAACRAGMETAYWFGPSEALLRKHAWYRKNSDDRTHDLAESVQAGGHENPWGLYDMHGNVWEWCADWHHAYDARALVDPLGQVEASGRVFRGGSWADDARRCRAAYRRALGPAYRRLYLGFRVAAVPLGGAGSKEE